MYRLITGMSVMTLEVSVEGGCFMVIGPYFAFFVHGGQDRSYVDT